MRKLFIFFIMLTLATTTSAVVINNTAGNLAQDATDHDITSLTITGTVDARDFKFIADSLTSLADLDLSQAQIVAYENRNKALVGTVFSFPDNELPTQVLMGTHIANIQLPTSLKSIGTAALAGCTSMSNLVLPEGLETIGDYAFSASGLEQVSLPESVTSVGVGAWSHCASLTTATFNLAQVPENAFMGDTLLSDLTLGNKVTTIGKGAFNGCQALQAVKVDEGNTIATIEAQAFIGAGAQAFSLASLPALKEIGDWAFASSGIANAAIQDVEQLGQGVFYYAQGLTQLSLPQNIDEVPQFAFAGTTSLAGTVTVQDGTSAIGDYAFYNNNNVSVYTMPASISHLGDWAMAGMTALDTINIAATVVPTLGDNVWAGVQQNTVMLNTVDNETADLYGAAEQWKEFHILRNYLLGDANSDGIVDIVDVNAMVAYVLEQPVTTFCFEAADVNQDSIVDVIDINAVVSYLLNETHEYIRKINSRTRNISGNVTNDCVTIKDLNIAAGKTVEVQLELNSSRDYTAMQFDINMPQGLAIVPGSLRCTSRNNGHSLLLSNNGSRIITFSNELVPITGNDGGFITMKVAASEDFIAGGTIDITSLILSTTQSERYIGTDTYAQVDTATGVDQINLNSDKVYAYGNTLVIETLEDAVAQIVAMNGSNQVLTVKAGRTQVQLSTGVYVVRLGGNSYKVTIR